MKLFFYIVSLFVLFPLFSNAQQGKYFDRVIFVIFENKDYDVAIKQNYFHYLATEGALLSNMYAIQHPSQPNYVALTSGATQGVKSNGLVNINAKNITDLLEDKGISWAVYAEDFPGFCFTGQSKGSYARKHNPFISYLNIQKDSKRCSRIHNAKQFETDASNHHLSEYIFYIPNNKNNGHDTSAQYADQWYEKTFSPYFEDESFMKNTVVITTFDEGSYFSNNQIYTSLYGPGIKKGDYSDRLTLYSLLRLVEDNWDLGTLGENDSSAPLVPDIWN